MSDQAQDLTQPHAHEAVESVTTDTMQDKAAEILSPEEFKERLRGDGMLASELMRHDQALRAQIAAKDRLIEELRRPPEVEDWGQLVAGCV